MSEEKTKTAEQTEKEKLVKQTQDESKSPEQKHKDYLATVERLHNEP